MLPLNVIIKILICLSTAESVFEKGEYFRMTVIIKEMHEKAIEFPLKMYYTFFLPPT